MVDAVVSVFLERLLNTLVEEGRVVTEFRDQFERLQSELSLMQSFLKDADKQKRKNNTLRGIMAKLRELIYEAEDILADCELQSREEGRSLTSSILSCVHPAKLMSQYQTGKRLKELNDKITSIKQDITSYLSPAILNVRMDTGDDHISRWSSAVYDHTQVVGLDGDKMMIKDWLFEADEGMLEIGIIGMGGLGKTTIAHVVFNDRAIEDHFERRMWVSVSQTLDEEQIMRSMLRSLGDASVGENKGELLKKINQYLSGKKYLLVMDDVWSLDVGWWNRLKEGLPKVNGSSVIITTRNKEVVTRMGVIEARIHEPKFLSKADGLLLFWKIAFADCGGKCNDSELERIGEEIVQKCKGLPLAIKAIGGMLLYKKHYKDWRRIAENFRDELAEKDDSVRVLLQLSYDELPPFLKSCFLSFSLYPEDCVITKEQVTRWWIGEGFISVRSGGSSTQAAENCFSGLTNRCLLEVVDKTYSGTIYTCKLHDMVRDLVLQMAKDDAFFQIDQTGSRHESINSNTDRDKLSADQRLRALISTTHTGEVNKIKSNITNKFSKCKYMRVLDVSKSIFERPLTGLLYQVGSLQHLTCLSLSNTHPLTQLPPSLKNLNNLQVLDVSFCQNLQELPSYLATFKKLVVLDARHCGSLEYLPKGLGRLSNLEVLFGFRPARLSQVDGCRLSELRNLTKLMMLSLHVTRSEEISDDEVNVLENLRDLEYLTISCFDCHGTGVIDKLDKLYPPKFLHELSLKHYPGKISPAWLNPISLPGLRNLSITSGNITKMHESFWGESNTAWKIEALMLESLLELEMDWPVVRKAIPDLRTVTASWCPGLISFPVEDVGFRGGVWINGDNKEQ